MLVERFAHASGDTGNDIQSKSLNCLVRVGNPGLQDLPNFACTCGQ
jgi:hypothetical protein